MPQSNKHIQHIQLFILFKHQGYREKIRYSPSFPGILGVLEEVKEEVNNIDTVMSK